MELTRRLTLAWYATRAGKRFTAAALAFELDAERNLAELRDEILEGRYRCGRAICFVTTECAIPREVWAKQFRDRIVERAIYDLISPAAHRHLIHDTFACIPGRGTKKAAERLEHHARSCTRNWSRRAFFLKCDVSNFFVSIRKSKALELLMRWVPDPWWGKLLELCLMHDCRRDCEYQGDLALLDRVPPHKRLTSYGADVGLPIGNLLSQFGANLYLDVLDQFIKHVLKVRHYCRYVDDFVLIHESPQQLNTWLSRIQELLRVELGLDLNPRKTILQPCSRGIDFAGQVIHPRGRTLRRRTQRRALNRMRHVPAADFTTTANSYLGLARQASRSHCLRRRMARIALDRGHVATLIKVHRKKA